MMLKIDILLAKIMGIDCSSPGILDHHFENRPKLALKIIMVANITVPSTSTWDHIAYVEMILFSPKMKNRVAKIANLDFLNPKEAFQVQG